MRNVALHNSRAALQRLAVAIVVLLALLAVFGAGQASAHASLVKTEPADGAMLQQSPSRFSLAFSEPVSPLVLTLVRPDGTPERLTSFRSDGQTLDIDNPQPLGNGTHVLSWRVISADGHPVGGSLLFSVGSVSAAPAAGDAIDPWLHRAIWVAKIILYLGLFFGVGGAFALGWLAGEGRGGERFVATMLLVGLIAAPISLGLQGLDALGAPFEQFAQTIVWKTAFATSFVWTALIAAIALGLGLLALVLPRADARPFAAIALIAVGVALAASGHASAAAPQWLTRPMVFLHGVGIAFWAGALAPLAVALKRQTPGADMFLRRFSLAILPVVATLVVAGIVLAVIQVETFSALVDTDYGRLLLAKLALVVGLFALAATNRWALTRPTEAGQTAARHRLIRSIAVETLIVLAIFGIAAGWRFTPPPRALAIAAAEPVSTHMMTLQAMADLTVTPGKAGPVSASIMLMTGDFGPLDPKEVTLVLSRPEAGIEPLKRAATKPGDGTWRVDGLVIPFPGRWTVRLDILVSDFEMVKLEGSIHIRP
ncbi:MAG TPA: copper resistance CopC/CopD family protein [Mesorhizobium sp.]|jgi:copper transport protein|uniref:copper resistance CopC/CopD family protein n=1 Tax=Mesorhizobium sp. TaxID=1871066 RepID=UPI002DDD76E5|nr:copper resistance CopC/CopD family protein [Mesorhizobium sp.]HEV2502228.1 copper resistance CopC/CopD family protein [Mesorhizobium sp.]